MFAIDSTYVGVEPVSSQSFVYAALDKNLNVIARAEGGLEETVAFLCAQPSATAAIDSPSGVNHGLAKGKKTRLAEYQLRARGIRLPAVPDNEEACPARMRAGFALYRALAEASFEPFSAAKAERRLLETHSGACFFFLLGQTPLPRTSLEGRLQRQAILYERGLRIKDPMNFFEELTRHKIMRGVFPMEFLYQPKELDALAAAYIAWLALNKPENLLRAGDEREGVITLPQV